MTRLVLRAKSRKRRLRSGRWRWLLPLGHGGREGVSRLGELAELVPGTATHTLKRRSAPVEGSLVGPAVANDGEVNVGAIHGTQAGDGRDEPPVAATDHLALVLTLAEVPL